MTKYKIYSLFHNTRLILTIFMTCCLKSSRDSMQDLCKFLGRWYWDWGMQRQLQGVITLRDRNYRKKVDVNHLTPHRKESSGVFHLSAQMSESDHLEINNSQETTEWKYFVKLPESPLPSKFHKKLKVNYLKGNHCWQFHLTSLKKKDKNLEY